MTPELHAAVERLRDGHRGCRITGCVFLADLALLAAAVDAGARAMSDALKKYEAEHVAGECRKWMPPHRGSGWNWTPENDCTCGLAALLQPEAPRTGMFTGLPPEGEPRWNVPTPESPDRGPVAGVADAIYGPQTDPSTNSECSGSAPTSARTEGSDAPRAAGGV